jgi:8-oxo-dGTP pyrophosphatase MutT (NUDIX family)
MPEASWIAEPGSSHTLEENWLFRLRRERFRSRTSGKSHDYFIMDLADAVNVVALTKDRQVVLVRQFRAGSNSDSLEPPGGLLEAGEDPRAAGARELLEETGYEGGPGVVLGVSWANPSILGSRITTILIEDAECVREPELDASEEVSVELHAASEIPSMIRSGAIDHALAVGGLLLWLLGETTRSRA